MRDVDGDGRDELYVSVEARTSGSGAATRIVEPVEILRFDAGTDPKARNVIATIDDRLMRFLTAGDVDGDGKKEIVAAGFKSGLWLLRPGADPKGKWEIQQIDRNSSGFEHAALLTDLDGDGVDELYVASDDQGEVRRYVWKDGQLREGSDPHPQAGGLRVHLEPDAGAGRAGAVASEPLHRGVRDVDAGRHVAIEVERRRARPRRAIGDDADAARAQAEEAREREQHARFHLAVEDAGGLHLADRLFVAARPVASGSSSTRASRRAPARRCGRRTRRATR